MKQEQWIQILVGGVILVTLGFLGSQVFDMKGTLSSVKTKVEETDGRVTRIADTLPDVKVRVAWEEVNHAISGFVVLSQPQLNKEKKWVTAAAVYSRDSEKMKIYSVALDDAHKRYVSYVVAGKLKSDAPYESSFSELATYSAALKQPVTIPSKLDANTSFVLRSADAEELSKFMATLTKEKPKTVDFGKIRNWAELSKDLESIATKTEPNKPLQPTP